MALDNFRTIELIWDKANKSIIKTIKTASSDTTGRYLSVKILDGGQEVTLNGAKLQLYWEHPNFNTSGTDDFSIVNDGGLFNMTFSDEMLTNIGELNAHLVLTLSDGTITSDGFPIKVFKGADDGVVVPTNGSGLVNQIANKIDKGNVTLGDLTQEVKLALTGGAVAVVGENTVGTENIKDGSVIPEVTNFFEISKNLFDFTDERIVDGYIVNDLDGTLTLMNGGDPLYYVSHPIRAIKGRPIFIPYVTRLALYDNSGNYIEGVRQSLGPLVYTPSANGYIKFASHKLGKATTDMQVEYGESETEYVPFIKKIKEEFLSEAKDITVTPEQTTFFEKSKNIFNKNEVESGFYLDHIAGNKAYIESYETSGYIPMIKDVPVSINLVYTINFYDVQKNRISGKRLASNQQHTFTPTYDGFFRFSYNASVIPSHLIQVEYNDTSTDFEPAYTRIKPEFIDFGSKLSGKSLANFGDSIASAQTEGVDGYHEIISTKHSMILHNFARNGAKVTNIDGETNHIKTQLDSAIAAGINPDYVLFDGLRNDVMNDIITFGEITTGYDQTLNLATFCGAFEYYCKTMRETWLEAKIIYVRTHNTSTVSYDRQKQLGELTLEICEKYSIPVVDIWKEGGINTQFSGFVGPYTLTDTDATHPNTLGYEKFYVPLIESKMLAI